MKKIIVVAGATGNLGGRIAHALVEKGAEVRAIVRSGSSPEKLKTLEQAGVQVFAVDMQDVNAVAEVCRGASCVVSALAGLRETIIDTQKILLDGAVAAGVPRFIPSDFSLDFTNLIPGRNRNLDLRREFHEHLDKAPIKATTIFIGPFMDLLTGDMPMILFKQRRILYWGKADLQLDFTTIQDTALFTAFAALDDTTPRFLRVAGDQLSARDMSEVLREVTGQKFRLLRAGGTGLLNVLINIAHAIAPGKKDELYPAWQGMQYVRDMMEGRAVIQTYDNIRYDSIRWTTVQAMLHKHHVLEN